MNIAVIGLNHQTAPAEIRERAVLTDSGKIEMMTTLLDEGIHEVVVLNTCGRSECYIAMSKEHLIEGIELVKGYYQSLLHTEETGYLYQKTGSDAIEHMVQVAVGLDSIVLGEDQIIGQMKNAYDMAREHGATKRILNVLFRDAISSAKEIKTALKISEIPLSLSYIGVKLLDEKVGLKGKKVLVVGLGEMGRLALENAVALGAHVFVTSRNQLKNEEYLSKYPQICWVDYDEKVEAVKGMDCLISATAAPHTIFTKEDFADTPSKLHILDLSLPRDVDIRVKELEGIELINIDTIQSEAKKNEKKREELILKAHTLVGEQVAVLFKWLEKTKVHETLKDLGTMINDIHSDSMEYLNTKLTISRHEMVVIEKTMKSALKRVVRNPILNLKAIEDEKTREQMVDLLSKLFSSDWEA